MCDIVIRVTIYVDVEEWIKIFKTMLFTEEKTINIPTTTHSPTRLPYDLKQWAT